MDELTLEVVKILLWPSLLIIILILFKKPISVFIMNWGKTEIKIDKNGIAITAEVVKFITKSSIEKVVNVNKVDRAKYIEEDAKGISEVITKIQNNLDKIRDKKILWIDDHPEWNINEKSAFETMGMRITWSMTNSEALDKIKTEDFDLIISDLFSDEGQPKGFNLSKELKIENIKIPVIFYTGLVTQDIKEKAEILGAFGIVDSSASLTSKVLSALIEL
ncbi:MAG: response regulator [Gammaproteobacteria bacterium]|nr:response regulator [Gammaproteobacteria bacterium]